MNTMLRRFPLRFALLFLVMLVFVAVPSTAGYYTDWLWFSEVGYQQVFTTSITAQLLLGALVFVVAAVWLFINLRVAIGAMGDRPLTFTTREGHDDRASGAPPAPAGRDRGRCWSWPSSSRCSRPGSG